ncbi:hypothetical protein KSP39_PZI005269 [Platanthera zijinensis]|uniref:Uncharacterized protein n=1 Tax=Platanthera zijinensis TaxID=2320716 RepID=A0AAP0BUG2_9ASPA
MGSWVCPPVGLNSVAVIVLGHMRRVGIRTSVGFYGRGNKEGVEVGLSPGDQIHIKALKLTYFPTGRKPSSCGRNRLTGENKSPQTKPNSTDELAFIRDARHN